MRFRIFRKSLLKKLFLPVLAAALTLSFFLMMQTQVTADSAAEDFETFTPGSVNGQGGWRMTGSYDVEVITNTYGFASFGNYSLRISNAVISGAFSDQTFSHELNNEAGESTARNDGESGGVRQDYFEASWDFASTVTTTEQAGLQVVVSPDRGDGARMSWIQMADTPTGLAVNFYGYNTTLGGTCSDLDNFVYVAVASGLDRAVPHNIKVTMQFNEGINNDVVKVYVDGVLQYTGKDWEDYFRNCEPPNSRTVDSLLFRVSGTAAPATSGAGFLIDNVSLYSGPCPLDCYTNATTVVVDPDTAGALGWGFLEETPTGSGEFAVGPATPPIGSGSARLTVDDTGGVVIGTQLFAGMLFTDVTRLKYSAYQNTAGNAAFAPTLQMNVDYDLTDADTTWQGRLVYEPYLTGVSVISQTWQTWNALNGAGWWATGAPGNTVCTQGSPCTWQDILTNWPNAGVQTGILSGLLLKAGGGWSGGFDGNVDMLIVGRNGSDTIYNFEWAPHCTDPCYVNGATGNDAYSGNSPTSAKATIQAAVDQVNVGGDVIVASGIYTGNVVITKHVSILGAGSGSDPASNTVLREDNNSAIVTLQAPAAGASAADPLLLQDLRIEPQSAYGINVVDAPPDDTVSYVKLENVHVVATNEQNDTESEVGLKVSTNASLTNLEINNSAFNNLTYGWYFAKQGNWGPGGSIVSSVVVSGTTFNNNDAKGIYVEKLSDAAFINSSVQNNGLYTSFWNARWNAGFDINLKGEETYQNLSFSGMTFSGNALNTRDGAALMIKARDDGATYGAYPASLTNVTIQNSFFTGNERGIRFGEPDKNNATPTNITVTNNSISGNAQTYTGTDGSAYGGVINYTQATVNAAGNYWGAEDGPGPVGPGSGDAVTTAVTYDPWLCDGTDTSPDPGFQPNPGQLCKALYLPIVFKN